MVRKSAAAGLLGALLVCAPAQAESFDWTGFYAGVQGGYQWRDDVVFREYFASDGSFSRSFAGFDAEGGLGGAHIGYAFQSGAFVYGLEASAEASTFEGEVVTYDDRLGVNTDWLLSMRARAGYAFGDTLIFATGGLAVGDAAITVFDAAPLPSKSGEFRETRVGFTVGAGIEHAISERFSIRGEYKYTDLGEASEVFATIYPDFRYAADVKFHSVLVGLSYHFD